MDFEKITINRVIIHKIIAGAAVDEAYCEYADDLHVLDEATLATLLLRIEAAVKKTKRFFETQVEQTHDGSFFDCSKGICKSTKEVFVDSSQKIADLAVIAHRKKSTKGGLLIVIDAKVDDFDTVIIVKAELQEALTIVNSTVELIKDLFLSPGKEFYKLGFLIKVASTGVVKADYESYVYDDQFTPAKEDLALYFYSDLLGFSTSENDKLHSNNFFTAVQEFANKNIDEFDHKKNIKSKLISDFESSFDQVVDPKSYSEFFEEGTPIREKFEKEVLGKFSKSFTKDLSLMDYVIKRGVVPVAKDVKIVGTNSALDRVEVFDISEESIQRLRAKFESGNVVKVITLSGMQRTESEEAK